MKTLQSLILLLWVITNVSAQKLDCRKFRTGTFYTKQIPENGYTVRTKKTQTSYYTKTNMELTWKVKWTSDCTYELHFVSVKNSDRIFKTGDKIFATITSIDDSCYSFKATFYNSEYPEGKDFPPADMCLKVD